MKVKNSVQEQNNKGQRTEKPSKRREKKPPKKITEKYLYNAGLAYLQRFTASTEHFRKTMTRKIDRSCTHHADQNRDDCLLMLQKTIDKFQDLALLDDTAYTKGMVTSLRNRGLSRKAILFKLLQKGLPEQLILKSLELVDDNDSDAEIIAALRLARRKKIGPYRLRGLAEEKELAQMARAGFGYEICRKIISMDSDEAEELTNSRSL